jgi:hypothetical protein
MGRVVEMGSRLGTPVVIGKMRVVPVARALIVRWAGGAWVWRRPLRVLVSDEKASRVIPIRDINRCIQVAAAVAALALGILVGRIHRAQKGEAADE